MEDAQTTDPKNQQASQLATDSKIRAAAAGLWESMGQSHQALEVAIMSYVPPRKPNTKSPSVSRQDTSSAPPTDPTSHTPHTSDQTHSKDSTMGETARCNIEAGSTPLMRFEGDADEEDTLYAPNTQLRHPSDNALNTCSPGNDPHTTGRGSSGEPRSFKRDRWIRWVNIIDTLKAPICEIRFRCRSGYCGDPHKVALALLLSADTRQGIHRKITKMSKDILKRDDLIVNDRIVFTCCRSLKHHLSNLRRTRLSQDMGTRD